MKIIIKYLLLPILLLVLVSTSTAQSGQRHFFKYKGWDAKMWQASIKISTTVGTTHGKTYQFEHTSAKGLVHNDFFIKYTTWDGTKWVAAAGDGVFYHFKSDEDYHADKLDHKSTVLHFVDENNTHWEAEIIGSANGYVSFDITEHK